MTAFWKDRPVLVTGAGGFLGRWVVKKLLLARARAICLIHDLSMESSIVGHGLLKDAIMVRGDVRAQEHLERILKEYSINTVFHLAAQAIVAKANVDPATALNINIAGTTAILEACRRNANVRQIVVASSDKAYGDAGECAYSEDTPLRGKHPYDVSKACADMIARSYAGSFELPVVVTRCGNFYGPGDLNWNRIVPSTIRSLWGGVRPVIRSDGKFVRDYFYIEDAAEVFLMIAEKLSQNPKLRGEAFNFSNETRVTVLELVEKIVRLMHLELLPEVRNEANNEIRYQLLNASKARNEFGWRPRFTLEEGLRNAIAWYCEYLDQNAALKKLA